MIFNWILAEVFTNWNKLYRTPENTLGKHEKGNYLFGIFEQEENILHTKLRSRHQSKVKHNIQIQYNPHLKLTEGQNPIEDRYCGCKAGARVIGMCAHITSILWYLSIARHGQNLTKIRKCDLFMKLCLDSIRFDQLDLNFKKFPKKSYKLRFKINF